MFTFNVPQMLGLGKSEVKVIDTPKGQRFVPLEAHGIKVMSVGLLAEADHPLAWRAQFYIKSSPSLSMKSSGENWIIY